MIEAKGNILEEDCSGIFITTNGFTKKDGSCVMGKGIAKQATMVVPGIEYILGNLIKTKGNKVHYITTSNDVELYSFPVKGILETYDGTNVVKHMAHTFKIGNKVPGWACKARVELIQQSVQDILQMLSEGILEPSKTYLLPRPGCGAGELNWDEVKPIMEELPDNFICMTF